MSYDVKCEDLAEAFLREMVSGEKLEYHAQQLAQEIQDTIEGYTREMSFLERQRLERHHREHQ